MSADTIAKVVLVAGALGVMFVVFSINSALTELQTEVRLLKSKVEWLEKRLRDG